MTEDGTAEWAHILGTLEGRSRAFSFHLFAVNMAVMIKAGLVTASEVADMLEGQAEAATDELKDTLRDYASIYRKGGRPELTIVK